VNAVPRSVIIRVGLEKTYLLKAFYRVLVNNIVLQIEIVVGTCFHCLINGFYPLILHLSLLDSMSN